MFFKRLPFMFLLFGLANAQSHCLNYTTDICINPHNPQSVNPQPVSNDRGQVLNSISNTREMLHNLAAEFGPYEERHRQCSAVCESMPSVSGLLQIQFCSPPGHQNNVTREYVNIAVDVQVFKVLAEQNMNGCSLSYQAWDGVELSEKLQTLYMRLENRILENWQSIYFNHGTRLTGGSCYLKARMRPISEMRCKVIHKMIYVVFRRTIRRLRSSVRVLEQLNRSMENSESSAAAYRY